MRILAAALVLIGATSALAAQPVGEILDVLVAAYPTQLAGHDGKDLIWRDGTRTPVAGGPERKSFGELLDAPSILDQFAIPYPLGTNFAVPAVNEDPGRIRNEEFFRKMYGNCRSGEVERRLKAVPWLASRGGGTIRATNTNGVADKLAAVARDLEALPESMTKYLVPIAGTYNCRSVAGTKRLSVHAFGAAIDLSTKFGDYWLWAKGKDGSVIWRNRMPPEIADVFERHGFIWGGKWYHFDTFHFEYRPEIIALAKRGSLPR